MSEYILKVDESHLGLRLDVFLVQNLEEAPSRTFMQGVIEAGGVAVNGKVKKSNYKIELGDEVRVQMPDIDVGMDDLQPENIPLDIVYEDKHLLVIHKPIGMLVHPTHTCKTGTLVNALLFHCQKLSNANEAHRPGIVHRLDRETSGLLLVAKDNKTHAALAGQFEHHEVKKQYIALVEGKIEFDEGIVDAPLGRHPVHFDKKSVSFEEDAKEAKTFYRVTKRFGTAATLVALFPESGRTHQLRVHMKYIGHPILGDDKYGSKRTFPRLALHAQSIGFQHPVSKKQLEFTTPTPAEFLNFSA